MIQVTNEMPTETVDQFLARGGRIVAVPARYATYSPTEMFAVEREYPDTTHFVRGHNGVFVPVYQEPSL